MVPLYHLRVSSIFSCSSLTHLTVIALTQYSSTISKATLSLVIPSVDMHSSQLVPLAFAGVVVAHYLPENDIHERGIGSAEGAEGTRLIARAPKGRFTYKQDINVHGGGGGSGGYPCFGFNNPPGCNPTLGHAKRSLGKDLRARDAEPDWDDGYGGLNERDVEGSDLYERDAEPDWDEDFRNLSERDLEDTGLYARDAEAEAFADPYAESFAEPFPDNIGGSTGSGGVSFGQMNAGSSGSQGGASSGQQSGGFSGQQGAGGKGGQSPQSQKPNEQAPQNSYGQQVASLTKTQNANNFAQMMKQNQDNMNKLMQNESKQKQQLEQDKQKATQQNQQTDNHKKNDKSQQNRNQNHGQQKQGQPNKPQSPGNSQGGGSPAQGSGDSSPGGGSGGGMGGLNKRYVQGQRIVERDAEPEPEPEEGILDHLFGHFLMPRSADPAIEADMDDIWW